MWMRRFSYPVVVTAAPALACSRLGSASPTAARPSAGAESNRRGWRSCHSGAQTSKRREVVAMFSYLGDIIMRFGGGGLFGLSGIKFLL